MHENLTKFNVITLVIHSYVYVYTVHKYLHQHIEYCKLTFTVLDSDVLGDYFKFFR